MRTHRLPRALHATALAVIAVAFSGCGSADQAGTAALAPTFIKAGSLTVCTSLPYEPFEFEQDGKPAGFDIDLANEVAEKLDVRSVFLNTDFDQIQSGQLLNEGKCDMVIAGLTITGERARVLDFSSPYFNAAQAMVVRKGSGISALKDLAGHKVGVQGGTTGELYVTDNAPDGAQIVTFKDTSQIDEALASGQVDAGIYDNTVVGDVIGRHGEFLVAAEFDTGEQYGMAVKKNSNVDLLRTINDVLAELRAGGQYDAIYDKWFGKTAPA